MKTDISVREKNLFLASSPSEPCGDVYGRLPVPVALVDVDRGHGEQLLEALQIVLLDRAEDRREHKVVLL